MKLRRKLFAAVSSLAVASAVLLAGCGAPAQEGTALKETGVLTLSVNPEIQIEYNRDGKVTALTGRNDDGKGIVEAYPDYIGKDCEAVLRDLIVEINEAGYFVDDIDGNKKNIVLQLEPGSVLPSDDFLADMSVSTQEAVKGLELSSGIVTIDDDDYDPAYAKDGKPSPTSRWKRRRKLRLPRRMSMQRTRYLTIRNSTTMTEPRFLSWSSWRTGTSTSMTSTRSPARLSRRNIRLPARKAEPRPPAAVPPITTIPITARIMTA